MRLAHKIARVGCGVFVKVIAPVHAPIELRERLGIAGVATRNSKPSPTTRGKLLSAIVNWSS